MIDTGPYAYVRHPMYAGALWLFIGMPLALGSWLTICLVPLILPVLFWRLLDEERILSRDLSGYNEYASRVRHRLIPYIWQGIGGPPVLVRHHGRPTTEGLGPGPLASMYPYVAPHAAKIHTLITPGIRHRFKPLVLKARKRLPRGFDSHRPLQLARLPP